MSFLIRKREKFSLDSIFGINFVIELIHFTINISFNRFIINHSRLSSNFNQKYMNEFFIFLKLGYDHITDLQGYDHILFILSLCVVFRVHDWRKILILVTAFTIGHSITLAMAAMQVINYSSEFIEFLIPVTIIITSISNLFHKSNDSVLEPEKFSFSRYLFALGFGLIHGLGFSSYLRSLLGKEQDIISQLLAFNIGLEVGQLMIVILVMVISFFVLDGFHVKKHTWNLVASSFIAGIAFKIMTEKWVFEISDIFQALLFHLNSF